MLVYVTSVMILSRGKKASYRSNVFGLYVCVLLWWWSVCVYMTEIIDASKTRKDLLDKVFVIFE